VKKKKDKNMLSEFNITKEDMEWASQVVAILDDLMFEINSETKFEHLVAWWTACDPADA